MRNCVVCFWVEHVERAMVIKEGGKRRGGVRFVFKR